MDPEPCAHCGAPDAPTFCAGFRAVCYCGVQCQRVDWRDHKPRCKHVKVSYHGEPARADETELTSQLGASVDGMPNGYALTVLLRAASPSARADSVFHVLQALHVDRLKAALAPGSGVTTATRVGVNRRRQSVLHCAGLMLSHHARLRPELHERALVVWEAALAAAPLTQLTGTADFTRRIDEEVRRLSRYYGATPLLWLCSCCKPSLALRAIDALLRRVVDVSGVADEGATPLCLFDAVQFQTATVVRRLQELGIDSAARAHSEFALHVLAAEMECPGAAAAKVRLLVDAGANLEALDAEGRTPLQLAAFFPTTSLRAFDALLEAGASTAPLAAHLPVQAWGLKVTTLHANAIRAWARGCFPAVTIAAGA